MRKKLLLVGLFLLSFSMAFVSCKKSETVTTATPAASGNQVTLNYILDGVTYPITIERVSDDSTKLVSTINDTLSKVLDLPNSALLKDPFNANTYYVFKSEEDSKWKRTQIIQQLNEVDTAKKTLKSTSCRLFCYKDINFNGGIICSTSSGRDVNGEDKVNSLDKYNDQISSYIIKCEGARSDGKRVVVVFHEDSDCSGHTLTAFGNFNGTAYNSWLDTNMHDTFMCYKYTPFQKSVYWGDQVSSISWSLD